MKQESIALFKSPGDFYTSLGISPDCVSMIDGFSFCRLCDVSSQSNIVMSPAYRTGFYSILFVKQATGKYFVNQNEYEIVPGSLCMGLPGDFARLTISNLHDAYLLTITESFLKEHTYPDVMQEFPFLLSEAHARMIHTDELLPEIERLFKEIDLVQAFQSTLHKKQITYLILLVLLKIKEKMSARIGGLPVPGARTNIVRRFKALLHQHYQDLHNGCADKIFHVREYADALGMHPCYLNQVIKDKTGMPVSQWIIDKTIAESKWLLGHSSLSIKEIAYRLGFTESSYFCRYFKKYTQSTAAAYRRNLADNDLMIRAVA